MSTKNVRLLLNGPKPTYSRFGDIARCVIETGLPSIDLSTVQPWRSFSSSGGIMIDVQMRSADADRLGEKFPQGRLRWLGGVVHFEVMTLEESRDVSFPQKTSVECMDRTSEQAKNRDISSSHGNEDENKDKGNDDVYRCREAKKDGMKHRSAEEDASSKPRQPRRSLLKSNQERTEVSEKVEEGATNNQNTVDLSKSSEEEILLNNKMEDKDRLVQTEAAARIQYVNVPQKRERGTRFGYEMGEDASSDSMARFDETVRRLCQDLDVSQKHHQDKANESSRLVVMDENANVVTEDAHESFSQHSSGLTGIETISDDSWMVESLSGSGLERPKQNPRSLLKSKQEKLCKTKARSKIGMKASKNLSKKAKQLLANKKLCNKNTVVAKKPPIRRKPKILDDPVKMESAKRSCLDYLKSVTQKTYTLKQRLRMNQLITKLLSGSLSTRAFVGKARWVLYSALTKIPEDFIAGLKLVREEVRWGTCVI